MPTGWVQENHFTSKVPDKMCCCLSRSARFLGMPSTSYYIQFKWSIYDYWNCVFIMVDFWHFSPLSPFFLLFCIVGMFSTFPIWLGWQFDLFVEQWNLVFLACSIWIDKSLTKHLVWVDLNLDIDRRGNWDWLFGLQLGSLSRVGARECQGLKPM